MNDIIVGVDQSETAQRAATKAAELAAAFGANLHLVTCVDKSKPLEMSVGSDRFRSDPLADAQQELEEMARRLAHDQTTTAAAYGDPADFMCEEAARLDARAIVVGNRRVQGASRVLGSIAANVNKHAPCDVYVAHTKGD